MNQDIRSTTSKMKIKVMNDKEHKSLLKFLDSGDDTILTEVLKVRWINEPK